MIKPYYHQNRLYFSVGCWKAEAWVGPAREVYLKVGCQTLPLSDWYRNAEVHRWWAIFWLRITHFSGTVARERLQEHGIVPYLDAVRDAMEPIRRRARWKL